MALILIVEDNADSSDVLSHYLTKCGYKTACAPNGRLALSNVISHIPDLIVLDLMMPEMDGASFLEVLQSYARLRSVPVIVLTGLDHGPLVERLSDLDVRAILVKSQVSLAHIAAAVDEALSTGSQKHPSPLPSEIEGGADTLPLG